MTVWFYDVVAWRAGDRGFLARDHTRPGVLRWAAKEGAWGLIRVR